MKPSALTKSLLSPYWVNGRLAPPAFPFGHSVPLEGESPIKTSDHGLFGLHVEFKGVPVNGVDDWAHDGTGVFSNPKTQPEKFTSAFALWSFMLKQRSRSSAPFQKRLYPSGHALAVAVEEGQHLAGSIGGTDQTSPDQTFSFFGADETHAFQITDVVSKLGL